MIKSAYLAAAIDHASGFDPFAFMKERLAPVQCFDPRAAFAGQCHRDDAQVQDFICSINMHAMARSDVIVAYTDMSTLSFGMPMELLYAAWMNKPVILVVDEAVTKWLGVYAQFIPSAVIRSNELSLATVTGIVEAHKNGKLENQQLKRDFISRIFPEGW